ncbi:MAG: threonine--tRNA ligase [bacterium]|nr:threonine--tRNA ligase [bacterium]
MDDIDHKKLGRELDLFTFSDVVGKGLPLWTPKGAAIRREIERWVVDEEIKDGYQHVYTPDIASLKLYEKSGHYPYYKDSMYAPIQIEDEQFMLRPMSCPHHFELYLSRPHSWRELPLRIAELAKLYRFEKSGELMGLERVRSFCLADAHIICRPDQAESEIDRVLNLIERMAGVLGLNSGADYWYRLSLGDRQDSKKYFKDDAAWDKAEGLLRSVLQNRESKFVEAANEAAFYGPKIDIQMKNANGKEDTAFTVQYDFVMPGRFALTYINEKGENEQAIVIHRSSIGAIERLVAFLIEKYGGAFPTWLAPVQTLILPISDKHLEYAQSVADQLREQHIRVELNAKNEPLNARIRDAELEKVPYILVVGDKEAESAAVAVRRRHVKETQVQSTTTFISRLREEIATRSNN